LVVGGKVRAGNGNEQQRARLKMMLSVLMRYPVTDSERLTIHNQPDEFIEYYCSSTSSPTWSPVPAGSR